MSDAHAVTRAELRQLIERIERLEEEKASISDDIKDVYGEAKGRGYDTKAMRTIVRLRKKDANERLEEESILQTYMAALGMIEQPGFFDDEPRQTAQVDRKARAAVRTSEAMDDNKAFSAELVAAGLISEEAHAENIALSDAIARKYGAGVIDTESGEILDDSRRSDAGLSIVTKHEDIRTAPVTAEESPRKAAEAVSERTAFTDATVAPVLVEAEKAEAVAGGLGQPDAIPALTVQHDGVNVGGLERAGVTAGETATIPQSDDGAIVAVNARDGLADAIGVEPSSSGQCAAPEKDAAADERSVEATVEQRSSALTSSRPDVMIEDVPPTSMKRLPYAHCFPELSNADYRALEVSVIAIGVSTPIIRMGDMIVDGWARYNIARNLGISYPVANYRGDDVLIDLIGWQRASRNFTPSQERKIAAELAKELPDRADEIMAAFGLAEALEAAE